MRAKSRSTTVAGVLAIVAASVAGAGDVTLTRSELVNATNDATFRWMCDYGPDRVLILPAYQHCPATITDGREGGPPPDAVAGLSPWQKPGDPDSVNLADTVRAVMKVPPLENVEQSAALENPPTHTATK